MKLTHVFRVVVGTGTLVILLPAIAVFLIHGYLIKGLVRDRVRRRWLLLGNIHHYSRFALWIMRIRVEARNEKRWTPAIESQLFVCNHMSYLDMLVLASVKPSVFVTSVDMGQQVFLGNMAEIAGAVFIERRNRDRVAFDISQLEAMLLQGFNVTLFPEGTSSDGSQILPFKRSMFLSAMNTGRPVRPLTLKYTSINGEAFGPANRDVVCWYGKMDFLTHLIRLCSAHSVKAEIVVHSALEHDPSIDKDALAGKTRQIILDEYFRMPLGASSQLGQFA